jgi:hypothetical protein
MCEIKISPISYEKFYYRCEKYGGVIIGKRGIFDKFLSWIFGADHVCKWFGHWGYTDYNYAVPDNYCSRCGNKFR